MEVDLGRMFEQLMGKMDSNSRDPGVGESSIKSVDLKMKVVVIQLAPIIIVLYVCTDVRMYKYT